MPKISLSEHKTVKKFNFPVNYFILNLFFILLYKNNNFHNNNTNHQRFHYCSISSLIPSLPAHLNLCIFNLQLLSYSYNAAHARTDPSGRLPISRLAYPPLITYIFSWYQYKLYTRMENILRLTIIPVIIKPGLGFVYAHGYSIIYYYYIMSTAHVSAVSDTFFSAHKSEPWAYVII